MRSRTRRLTSTSRSTVSPLDGTSLQQLASRARPRRYAGSLVSRNDAELGGEIIGIVERNLLRAVVDEEVERVDRIDVDRKLDHDPELGHILAGLERHARDAIAMRVALPVHPMLGRHVEAIALDACTRMIGRAQANELGTEQCRTWVHVPTAMLDEHAQGFCSLPPRALRRALTLGCARVLLRGAAATAPAGRHSADG